LNNVRCAANRYFRNKKKEYPKDKINELGENGDLLSDFNDILNRWKNCFPHLLNVHNVSDVGQREVHTAEPLVPGSGCLEFEITIANLKEYKSPGSDHISTELFQAGGETLLPVNLKTH
jgi:hypothetical protein